MKSCGSSSNFQSGVDTFQQQALQRLKVLCASRHNVIVKARQSLPPQQNCQQPIAQQCPSISCQDITGLRHRNVQLGCLGKDRDEYKQQSSGIFADSLLGKEREDKFTPARQLVNNRDGSEGSVQQPWWKSVGKAGWWQKRWTIILLCFVAFMLCNMDRVNMSIAILPMQTQFNWDVRTVGLVQSSFFWGYLLTQIIGGVIADRVGGKLILGLGVVWWSIATMITPIAAQLGLPVLLLARTCMGIGEGVAMPAMNNMLSRWVPVNERSRSLSLVYSGMHTGSIVGLGLSPHIIDWIGWPPVFYMFGSLGIVWYVFWQRRAQDSPAKDASMSDTERDYVVANTISAEPVKNIPWKLILSKKEVWAIILCHFCHNWGLFILLTWMPSYYNQVLGLDLAASGILSVLPWLTMAIFGNIGGLIADKMVSKGVSVTTVRKVMQTIGFLGPAFFLTQLSNVHDVKTAVLCMMASQGLDSFSHSGLYSNHQDIAPRYSGVLLGMSNTAGVFAGVLSTWATGIILHQYSWREVWLVAVALYVVGTVIWNLFATGEKVID